MLKNKKKNSNEFKTCFVSVRKIFILTTTTKSKYCMNDCLFVCLCVKRETAKQLFLVIEVKL